MGVMDNNNLGWEPEATILSGHDFGPKLASPPGWIKKRSWTSGFSGGMGKRMVRLVPATGKRKKRWTTPTQAIRGMWGKRAAKVLEEPFIGDSSLVGKPFLGDSLVGKPFSSSDLNCFYPWCQNWETM